MQLKVGLDLIEIERFGKTIERWGDKFLSRIFTDLELKAAGGRTESLAARFAAREALVKAFGTGLRGFDWRDVEITTDSLGAPQIRLHRRAAALSEQLGVVNITVSLSHTATIAGAVVIVITGTDGG